MKKYQKNKYAMYEAVNSYLDKNSSRYSEIQEFVSLKSSFRRKKEEIGLMEDLKKKSTAGRTKDKRVSRETVINQALAVTGAVRAFAKKTGNLTLEEEFHIPKSGFKLLRDSGLIIELNSIRIKAEQNSEALTGFGITSEYLTDFIQNITLYTNAVGARDTGKAQKTGAIETLQKLFREADSILESIDLLMDQYINSDVEFYSGYKSARVIMNLGIRHDIPEDSSNKNGKTQSQPELQNASEITQIQQ